MKKFLLSIIAIVVAGIFAVAPVFADQKCTLTSILGNSTCDGDGNYKHDGAPKKSDGEDAHNCSCDDGTGSSIVSILRLVVNIMTVGVGVLGVIGITIVGIQYLTAGGNEEQTRKAKRRLFELIIGLVAYVLIYSLLNWLIPNFEYPNNKPDDNNNGGTSVLLTPDLPLSDSDIAG